MKILKTAAAACAIFGAFVLVFALPGVGGNRGVGSGMGQGIVFLALGGLLWGAYGLSLGVRKLIRR